MSSDPESSPKPSTGGDGETKGLLLKRKDFLEVDESAKTHPNRTYYFKRNEDIDSIIDTCSKKLQSEPNNHRALYLRGSSYMKKGMLDLAIRDLSFVINHEPDHVDSLYSRGMTFSKMGKPELAIADLSNVLQLNPDHVNAAFARAACYNKMGLLTQAIEDYNFALFKDQALNSPVRPGTATDDLLGMNTSTLGANSNHGIMNRNRAYSQNSFTGSMNSNAMLLQPPLHANVMAQTPLSMLEAPFTPRHNHHNTNSSLQAFDNSSHSSALSTPPPALDSHPVTSSGGPRKVLDVDAAGIFSLYGVASPTLSTPKGRNFDLNDASNSNRLQASNTNNANGSSLSRGTSTFQSLSSAVRGAANSNNNSNHNNNATQKSNTQSTDDSASLSSSTSSQVSAVTLQSISASGLSSSSQADVHHNRAYELRKAGQYAQAIAEYTRALQHDSQHFKSLFNRGFAYDKLGQYPQALADYSAAININPDYVYCYYNRGITHDHMSLLPQALQDFTQAIQRQPQNLDFYHNRAYIHRKLGQIEAAIDDYGTILSLSPTNVKARVNRALCRERVDQLVEALQDVDEALRLLQQQQQQHVSGLNSAQIQQQQQQNQAHLVTCLLHRALCHERLEQLVEAQQDYTQALMQGAPPFTTLLARAKVVLRKQQQGQQQGPSTQSNRVDEDMLLAISDLSTALELSPHDSNALLLRGNAYKTLQNYPEAVLDFGRAIDALQLQHQQLQQHSAVEEPQSNHHSAGSTVNGKAAIGANGSGGGALSADEINAQLVLAYTQRGYCQRKREQFLLALQDYTQALLRAPQSIKAYNNRGFLYAKLGKYDEAIGDYTAAIALDPHNAYAYHNRGIAYDKLGLIDQAIADFGKVFELDARQSLANNVFGGQPPLQSQQQLQQQTGSFSSNSSVNTANNSAHSGANLNSNKNSGSSAATMNAPNNMKLTLRQQAQLQRNKQQQQPQQMPTIDAHNPVHSASNHSNNAINNTTTNPTNSNGYANSTTTNATNTNTNTLRSVSAGRLRVPSLAPPATFPTSSTTIATPTSSLSPASPYPNATTNASMYTTNVAATTAITAPNTATTNRHASTGAIPANGGGVPEAVKVGAVPAVGANSSVGTSPTMSPTVTNSIGTSGLSALRQQHPLLVAPKVVKQPHHENTENETFEEDEDEASDTPSKLDAQLDNVAALLASFNPSPATATSAHKFNAFNSAPTTTNSAQSGAAAGSFVALGLRATGGKVPVPVTSAATNNGASGANYLSNSNSGGNGILTPGSAPSSGKITLAARPVSFLAPSASSSSTSAVPPPTSSILRGSTGATNASSFIRDPVVVKSSSGDMGSNSEISTSASTSNSALGVVNASAYLAQLRASNSNPGNTSNLNHSSPSSSDYINGYTANSNGSSGGVSTRPTVTFAPNLVMGSSNPGMPPPGRFSQPGGFSAR